MDGSFKLTVNGQTKVVTTDPQRLLLEVLREDFQLTGTKYGCGEGWCGACTVLVDGKRTLACRTPIARVENQSITTIEGLAADNKLHPVQEAFLAETGMQCGYCTPGMILTAMALLNEKPNPTDAEIRAGMNGNLCRCCHYPKILKAVRRAAELTRS